MKTTSELTTRAATEEDLSLVKSPDLEGCFDADDTVVYEGTLRIEGDFDASNDVLIVLGDLDASGTVALDETGTLIVTGSLRAKNLSCEGNLEVHGTAEARETIFGFYEAGITTFLGTIKAPLFLEGNHAFEYEDEQLAVTHHIRFDNFQAYEGDAAEVRKVLSDAALSRLDRLIGIATDDEDRPDDREELLRSEGFLRPTAG
ncbi:MAG: polymer-forming cytoskeletal protein [Myxococcota bacterium]